MVFESVTRKVEEDEQCLLSPLPSFNLSSKEESTIGMYSLELSSTASTDTDSSLSISEDQVQQLDTVDLESPFGKLRHRTGEAQKQHHQEESGDEDAGPVDDSDSEHGLIPRRHRRKTNAAITKRYLFYALACLVGVSTLMSIQSSSYAAASSRVNNEEWRHFQMHTLPMVRKGLKRYQPEQEYTVVLRGGRLDLLQQSLDNFARCSSVKEVQLDYLGSDGDIPITLLSHDSRKVVPASESLSTAAVFLLSEGIMVSCSDMEKGEY
jgi:hypothetical protein